jgi:hypothetical protein
LRSDDLRERTQGSLTARGLDLCEHFVMCCAGVEGPAPADLFAQFAKNLADGDPRGEFSLEEFETAYRRLLSRGLLTAITSEDLARNEDWQAGRQNYHLGDVVFSEEGYRLHTEAIQDIFEGRIPPDRFTGIRRKW